jgi:S-formylglutathione hydrolase FrmB
MKLSWSIIPIIVLYSIAISTCIGSSVEIPAPSSSLAPTQSFLDKTQSSARLASTPQNQQVIQCSQPGKISRMQISSVKLKADLIFDVYFPPCYGDGTQVDYPALYLLHGQTYDQTQWEKLGVQDYADQLIHSGHILSFLVIMPYEQYQYRPIQGNTFPQAILEELIPWVEANLHARPQKNGRAIGGISRGASWAMRLALKNPTVFGAAGGHSLPTFNGDLDQLPNWLGNTSLDQLPRIYIDIGSSDPEVESAIRFEQALNKLGIPNEWHLNIGRHNEEYWAQHIEEYLDWYTRGWRILPSS